MSFSSTSSLTFLQAIILWNLQKTLENKVEKMAKNLISASTLARFLWVLSLLGIDIVISYHCIQFQVKPKIQSQENSQKPHLGHNLGSLGPNWSKFFYKIIS